MKTPKVEIIVSEAHRIKPGESLFVTVDPQFADLIPEVETRLFELGVPAAALPLPSGAIKFFAVEKGVEVSVEKDV